MDFGVVERGAGGGVDVQAAEVGAVVEGGGDGQVGEVLVTEDEDFALGGEEGELVFSGGGEGAELDVGEDGADVGG